MQLKVGENRTLLINHLWNKVCSAKMQKSWILERLPTKMGSVHKLSYILTLTWFQTNFMTQFSVIYVTEHELTVAKFHKHKTTQLIIWLNLRTIPIWKESKSFFSHNKNESNYWFLGSINHLIGINFLMDVLIKCIHACINNVGKM